MTRHVGRSEIVPETLSRGPDRRYLRRARPEKAHRGAAIAVRPSGFPGPVAGIPYAPGTQTRWNGERRTIRSGSPCRPTGRRPIDVRLRKFVRQVLPVTAPSPYRPVGEPTDGPGAGLPWLRGLYWSGILHSPRTSGRVPVGVTRLDTHRQTEPVRHSGRMVPDDRPAVFAAAVDGREPAGVLIAELRRRLTAGRRPLFVGVDGRSGAGKSTLAATVSEDFVEPGDVSDTVTVIEGDEFYNGGSADTWDRRAASEKAAAVIDWRRQRDVLQRLRRDGVAEWHGFDWESEHWDSDSVPPSATPTIARIAPVVVLEGAYSCRPELQDLLDLRVLLEIPRDVRRQRLIDREGDSYQAGWEARWSAAENYYFDTTMSLCQPDHPLAIMRV